MVTTDDPNVQPQQGEEPVMKQPLPNSTAVLVLGILTIVFGCCFSIVGVVLGIIAIVLAQKDMKLYNANPNLYQESSYKNLKAGQVTAIIGLVIAVVFTVFFLFTFSAGEFWEQYKEAMERAMERAEEN